MKTPRLNEPKNIRRLVQALVICCVVLFALDGIIHRHTSHPWEEMFGFYGVYGFVSCVILVLLAKELRKLLMRDEHYYEEETKQTIDRNGEESSNE